MRRSSITLVCLLASVVFAQSNRTSTLTGRLEYLPGHGLSKAFVRLLSSAGDAFEIVTDSTGAYMFSNLPAGDYRIEVQSSGFATLTASSINLAEGQQKSLPSVHPKVSSCGSPAGNVLQLLPSPQSTGSLTAGVQVDRGPKAKKSRPVANAAVTLICASNQVCGSTKTDATGAFSFESLTPDYFSIAVTHPGFYPVTLSGYEVQAGWNTFYDSVPLERCPLGDCDPRRRPTPRVLYYCE
jgi:Carboxypeptidase regulatory-like domain